MAQIKATVSILSMGDMGSGIARLLTANGYRVITNAVGRSQDTQDRIQKAAVELVSSDEELIEQSDYVLSIVPPRDAMTIAQRIKGALANAKRTRPDCLFFLDLNAISPSTCLKIHDELSLLVDTQVIQYLDGGIIGGPPRLKLDSNEAEYMPSIVVSGPASLKEAPIHGTELASLLNVRHVHSKLGSATGLKMCFAALNKGFVGLAIQSYTTAQQMGVLPELQEHLQQYAPTIGSAAERGLTGMPPKAYRWVDEMRQIAETFQDQGGFDSTSKRGKLAGSDAEGIGGDLFTSVAEIYKFIAEGTELGEEKTEDRKRGTSAKEVARICARELSSHKDASQS